MGEQNETCDVGNEYGSPVTTDYSQRKFGGAVTWVEIDLGLDDHNHLIKPGDRVNLAMACRLQACISAGAYALSPLWQLKRSPSMRA